MSIHYVLEEDVNGHSESHERSIILEAFPELVDRVYVKSKPSHGHVSTQKYKEILEIINKEYSLVYWVYRYEYPISFFHDEDEEEIENDFYPMPVTKIIESLNSDGIKNPEVILSNIKVKDLGINLYYGEYITYQFIVVPLVN